MQFDAITLFPQMFDALSQYGVTRRAHERGLWRLRTWNPRDFTQDAHRTVDDRPFGGGPGMLLKPEPIAECIEWLERRHGAFHKIALCPSGKPFRQARAEELRAMERVLLLCGRYEGFDSRLLEQFGFEELSIGDFGLAGGELPALCIVESVARLLPGVLNDERSALEESFGQSGVLDHPHYTRPRVFRGAEVPEVLLSGDHARIQRWREARARERTQERRPDLLEHKDRTSESNT